MTNPKKANQLQEIKRTLEQTKNWIFTDYQKLTANQMNLLRESLKKTGAELIVVKNKLLEKANPECRFSGPTAILTTGSDPNESLKALTDFIKNNNGLPEIKEGFVENRWLTSQEIQILASLPSRNELLAQLCGKLRTPPTRLVNVVSQPQRGLAYVLRGVSVTKRGDSHE